MLLIRSSEGNTESKSCISSGLQRLLSHG